MWPAPVGVVSGPSFAEEVARGLPTAVAVAATDAALATRVASLLRADTLRAYESDDIAGVETGGAVKNVLAIAAGASDALGFGNNARAALITRGLAETGRLSAALGGRRDTLMGLAGLGDLVLTCTGDLSRNRRVGLALAQGKSLAEILAELGHVAEGVASAAARAHAVAPPRRRNADLRRRARGALRGPSGEARRRAPAQARAAVRAGLASAGLRAALREHHRRVSTASVDSPTEDPDTPRSWGLAQARAADERSCRHAS